METPLVYKTKKGNEATNSVLVAYKFEKRHDHVIRDIRRVMQDVETANASLPKGGGIEPVPVDQLFAEIKYIDGQGREQPGFQISQKGFQILAMRFTGAKALAFQFEFLAAFERLHSENEQLKRQVNVTEATQEIARLAKYTEVPVQIEAVKNVAGALIGRSAEGFGIINHHRAVMVALTGERPSLYVSHAVEEGLRVKGKSGRAVLRLREPAKAATAAVMDDAVRQGHSINDIKAAGMVDALPKAFEAILSLGLKSADLEADKQAA